VLDGGWFPERNRAPKFLALKGEVLEVKSKVIDDSEAAEIDHIIPNGVATSHHQVATARANQTANAEAGQSEMASDSQIERIFTVGKSERKGVSVRPGVTKVGRSADLQE
jgi:hypothetical protein